MRRLLSML